MLSFALLSAGVVVCVSAEKICDYSKCREFQSDLHDDDCCATDADAFCAPGYSPSKLQGQAEAQRVTWLNAEHKSLTSCSGYNTCCSPCSEGLQYTEVHGKGCSSYIHMDDVRYGNYGGQYTLQRCAEAVKRLNGKEGCRGDYFFYESSGFCNCPTDTCREAPNYNAGGAGQLYKLTCESDGDALSYVAPHP